MSNIAKLFLMNIASVMLLYLNAAFGSTGGDSAEGLFLGIGITGLLTLVLVALYSIKHQGFVKKNIFGVCFLVLLSLLEASIVKWPIFFGGLF